MKMNKKGQGISLEVIIIAAIALIVLIAVVFIFTGRINVFGTGLEDCLSKTRHTCQSSSCATDQVSIPGTECDKISQYCCMDVFEKAKTKT